MARPIDLTGKMFGYWTAIKRLPKQQWECKCRCGIVRAIDGVNLRSGKTKSCGCAGLLAGDNNAARKLARKRHGENYVSRQSAWYKQASGIFSRCQKTKIECGFSSIAELATYLAKISPEECPVFNVLFDRGASGFSPWAPSVDRKDNTRGYVRGNLQIISFKANGMKANASPVELRQFANWVLDQFETTGPNEAGWSIGLQ